LKRPGFTGPISSSKRKFWELYPQESEFRFIIDSNGLVRTHNHVIENAQKIVVGINTAIYKRSGGNVGIGSATPID
jgi:S1-C subfamily serine protease